jgi:branched-subunit amino acid aminotransferase/4-amino-4-deoxychorismate lyase
MADFYSPAVVNGDLVQTSAATIPVTDDGFLRGDGVFEVIRVHRGQVVSCEAHLDRLDASAAALRLRVDRAAIENDLTTLREALSDIDDCLFQVAVTRAGNRVVLARHRPPDRDAVALAVIPHCLPPLLRGTKSLSYAANMLGTRLAQERGFDDALFVSEDRTVLECARSTIFWVTEGAVSTPPGDTGAVDSITGREIAELTTVVPSSSRVDDLAQASEVFIADTANDITPVKGIEGVGRFQAPGPLTMELKSALAAKMRAGASD